MLERIRWGRKKKRKEEDVSKKRARGRVTAV
jgi:hypothetical protein